MTEKYSYKRYKEHGYIICLDMNGNELWRFDMKKLLEPIIEQYMPKDATIRVDCYITLLDFKVDVFESVIISTWVFCTISCVSQSRICVYL